MTDEEAVDREAVEPTGKSAEETKPARKPMPLRTKALLGLLALMGVTFSVNAAHVYALENELREIAEDKESEWISDTDSPETVSIVTATKEYLIYGKVFGKVEVFAKNAGNGDRVTGINYFFSRDDGEWTETDSGICASEECQLRGAKAFEKK